MKRYYKSLFYFAALLLLTVVTNAQQPNSYSIKGWWGPGEPPFSPVVNQDGSAIFRIKAPKANKVALLLGEWEVKPIAMNKDSAGTWTVTTGPLLPGIYSYVFSVDGVPVADKANPVVKYGTEFYGSIVEVPGTPPRFDEVRRVPHGQIHQLKYWSSSQNKLRQLTVFLPPQYVANPSQKFPVLYLRHGGGDNETSWTQPCGRADIILENLIADGKAVPMIVVMPNGLTDGTWAGGSTKEGLQLLETELMTDIIPLIEKSYRVKKDGASNAIAGLSMGGGQALIMGLHHPEKFSWIGEFSSGLLSDKDFDPDQQWPGIINASLNKKLQLLWISCGTADPRYPGHVNLVNQLRKRNIQLEFATAAGGHEWLVWRLSLAAFMEKLFKTPVSYNTGIQSLQ